MIRHLRIIITALILTALMTGCDVFTKLDPIDFDKTDTAAKLADITGAKVVTTSLSAQTLTYSNAYYLAVDTVDFLYIPYFSSYSYVAKWNSDLTSSPDISNQINTNTISGISTDGNNNIYIAYPTNNSVMKFNSGTVTATPTSVSINGASSPIKFIYVTADTSYLLTNTYDIYYNSNGTYTPVSGSSSTDIAYDYESSLLYGCSNTGSVYKLTNLGAIDSSVTFKSTLNNCQRVAVKNGYVYAAGYITVDSVSTGVIQKFKSDGTLVCTYTNSSFTTSMGIAVNSTGRVFISTSNKIYYFDQ